MNKEPKLRTNFTYNLGYQILSIVLPLVTSPYISRVLGSSNVGIFSYTQAGANYFFLFAMLGVSNYGNRMVAAVRDNRVKLEKTFWEIYAFQFAFGAFVCVAYLFYCVFLVKEDRLVTYLQFFYVASGWLSINWLMFGLEQFKLTTIRNIAIRVGMAVLTFALVKDKNDLAIYTAIYAVGNLLSVLIIWPFALKSVSFKRPTLSGVVKHIRPNLILFWPVIAVSLYNVMDKLMLGVMSTKAEVGFYTYAENITQIPNTLILALDNVMLPRMANLYAAGKDKKASELMDNVMMFAAMAAAAMSFGLAGIGQIFAPWFYGEEYTRCGFFIVLLCPVIIFKGWAGALRTQYIIPNKRDKVYIISLTSGSIVNLTINAVLIPTLQGVGAIVGTVAAEFTVAFIQFYMLRSEVPVKKYVLNGLGFCIIGFIMGIVIYNLPNMSLLVDASALLIMIVQILFGAIIYLSLSIFYMVNILKRPVIANELMKYLHVKKRF